MLGKAHVTRMLAASQNQLLGARGLHLVGDRDVILEYCVYISTPLISCSAVPSTLHKLYRALGEPTLHTLGESLKPMGTPWFQRFWFEPLKVNFAS